VEEVLKVIDKEFIEKDSGCEACGYASCIDFASAVASGLAHTDMCLNFTLKNRQEYIKTLRATNEKLAKTQEALRESRKKQDGTGYRTRSLGNNYHYAKKITISRGNYR
jgi:Na+-translocating ferredoxin:NAD+ oxidoreductase RNF subunit RnfB